MKNDDKPQPVIGQAPETFSRKKVPKIPLIIAAVLIGVIGVYLIVHSLAATPTRKIYGVNNAAGWGGISQARQQLGVNGDRTCHDETNLDSTLAQEAANGMYFTVCVNSDEGLSSLNGHSQDYANLMAKEASTYGPGGTYWASRPQYAQYAIQSFEIMNEPYGWWYRGGDNDPAAYAHIAAAAIKAGKAANPNAKFYVPLAPDDIKLKNGSWVDWNQQLLKAEPNLFQLADGFSIHLYYTPSEFASVLDQHKNWAWSQPGGNGKPFIITESNLTDQQASPESEYVSAIPQFVQIAQDRSWVQELFIFCWHGFSGRDYLGFLSSSGTPRQSRINAYHTAIQQVTSTSPTPPPGDTTVSTVSLTAPLSGASVSGQINVTANASDNTGVSGVQFKLDGANLGSEDTSSPYSASWNTTTVANGSHSLSAVARDAAGNTASAATQTVTVNNPVADTTPPDTTITAKPSSSSTVTSASFSFTSSENSSTFECKIDGGSYALCTSPRVYSSLGVGSHTFSVRAIDAAQNTDSTPATYSWTILAPQDTTPPTVAFAAPSDGASVSGILTASANATDDTGVSKVDFYLDQNFKISDTGAPYNYSFDSKTLNNGAHTLTAKAYDAAGNIGTKTITVQVNNPDITPPSAPTGLSASALTSTSAKLTWNASSDSGSNASGVVKYNVLRNGIVVAQPTSTSYTDTSLTANTSYSYVVQAVDGAGNVSANSSGANVTTPSAPDTTAPSTPAGLAANAVNSNQVNLSWSASTDSGGSGLAGYNIYRNGSKINSSPVASTSYGDGTVSVSTAYSYTVEAVDGAGNVSAKSSAVSATTPDAPDTTPPSAPTGLQAKAVSDSEISLSWNASTDRGGSGLAGYKVHRGTSLLNVSPIAGTSYHDTTAKPQTQYSYTVQAVDGAGNVSADSNTVSVTTPQATTTNPKPITKGHKGGNHSTKAAAVKVTNRYNKPAAGALVTLNGYTVTTNIHGIAYFTKVPSGKQQVLINYAGKTTSKTIKVKDEKSKDRHQVAQTVKISLARNQLSPVLLLVPTVILLAAGGFIFRPWGKVAHASHASSTEDIPRHVVTSSEPQSTSATGRPPENPGAVYPPDSDHQHKPDDMN
jgi:fibronectin type 3 domain-containing protein